MKSRLSSKRVPKEMEPTESELALRITFQDTNSPFVIEQIFCFICGNHFHFHGDNLPTHCYVCGHRWQRGELALPDFMLNWFVWSKLQAKLVLRTSVIRVDGKIHTKSRKNINYDYFQVESFRRWGVRTFVVYNDEISKNSKDNEKLVARLTELMNLSDEDYEIYYHSKENKERMRKI